MPPETFGESRPESAGGRQGFHFRDGVGTQGVVVHEERVLLILRIVVIAEGDVFQAVKSMIQAKVLVFGHMGDPRSAARLAVVGRACNGQRLALEDDGAFRIGDATERLEQFGLAIACNARDAKDLASADFKADALKTLDLVFVDDAEVFDRDHDLAGRGGVSSRLRAGLCGRP